MSYRGIPVKKVFEGVMRKRGYEPDLAQLGAADRQNVADLVNMILREIWEGEYWPETLTVEQRQYRPDWDAAQAYAQGDEVLRTGTDGQAHYWRSVTSANTGHDPATDDGTQWTTAEGDLERTILLDQPWEATPIGRLDVGLHVFAVDPRVHENPTPLRHVYLLGDALLVKGTQAPAQPWVKFQLRTPEFSWTAWDADTAYAAGDLVYVESAEGVPVGQTFVALSPNTGTEPSANGDVWQVVEFPWFFRDCVMHAVAAEDMRDDEARYKERSLAEKTLISLKERTLEGQGTRRRAIR